MFESLKESWRQIREDPPGKRFRRQYRRRQASRKSIAQKVMLIGLGVVIVIIGIVMLPAPGPGTLVIFVGLGLIAQESLYLSMLLDKFELQLRNLFEWSKKTWNQSSVFLKSIIVMTAFILCLAFAYACYVFLF